MLSLLLFGCLVVAVRADIAGYVTGYTNMRFYADGHEHIYSPHWNAASKVTFPDYTEVLAIEGQYTGLQGGIKAWFENGIKSDASWRCSNTYHLGWAGPGYDDSGDDWEHATVISDPAILDVWHNHPPQLDGKGSWIWTKGYRNMEKKVYCRRRLHRGRDRQFSGDATCDNRMSLFCDGVQVAYSNNWTKGSKITCPWNTRVIAIACRDVGHQGGIKAAFNNGVKTDASWKCSTELDDAWTSPSFDDSAWDGATIVNDEITVRAWGSHPASLDGQAHWIWTTGYRMQDPIVYCRKTLTPGKAPKPLPSNGCNDYFNNWANGGGSSGDNSGSSSGDGSCNVDTTDLLNDIKSAIDDSTNSIETKTAKGFKDLDTKLDTLPTSNNDKIDKIVNALRCTCPARRG